MSGGSYDYACYEMEEGRLDKALSNSERATRDLAELAERTRGDFRRWSPERKNHEGPATPLELMALDWARGAVERFAADLARVSEQAKLLAPIFRDLEWNRSGDFGDDTTLTHLVVHMRERLGMPKREE